MIQNIFTETYPDIEVYSRGVCCRLAKDLRDGRGLVRRRPSSVARVSDNQNPHFPPPLFLWLGESKSLTTIDIAALNIFGKD